MGGIQAMEGGIRDRSGRFPTIAVPVLVALLVLGGACSRGTPPPDAAIPRNLILISIDTLRADRLGAYGYDRPTSPAMDALGRKGVRFEVAIAEACWTLPSHVTLMSGLPPALHGVTVPTRKVSQDVPLLAEVLRDAGFHTIGLTGGRFLSRRFGFERGFARFDDGGLSFAQSLAEAGARIAEMDPAQRFFVFIHTYDVHCPYDPPPQYAAQFETRPAADHLDTRGRCGNPDYNKMGLTAGQARFLSDRYDGSIRYADDLLGNFLARLSRLGVLDTTVVAIVSDHGEEFLEHGKIGHRGTLYIQALRVPWLMAGPGLPPQVVREPVGLEDFMPTVLDLLAVPAPPMRGTSVMPVIRGEREARRDRMVFSQNDWGLLLYSAVVGDHHIVVDNIHWVARFFDWRADPEEQANLARRDVGWDRDLWFAARSRFSALANDEARVTAEEAGPANAEEHEQLRALGYIER